MTREGEIEQAAIKRFGMLNCDAAENFEAGAQWADKNPHWISVDEELPSEGKYTATINKVGFQAVRYYKGGKWFSSYGNEYGDITHWLPLPQAPEKGGEE